MFRRAQIGMVMTHEAQPKSQVWEPMEAGPSRTPFGRALTFAVVAMGLLIVVGLAVVIGRITYLASKAGTQASSDGSTAAAAAVLAVPPGATIEHLTLSGNRLAVHYRSAKEAGLAIVDARSGKTVTRVKIVAQSQR